MTVIDHSWWCVIAVSTHGGWVALQWLGRSTFLGKEALLHVELVGVLGFFVILFAVGCVGACLC